MFSETRGKLLSGHLEIGRSHGLRENQFGFCFSVFPFRFLFLGARESKRKAETQYPSLFSHNPYERTISRNPETSLSFILENIMCS